jgi:hypothetical protein
VIKGQAIARRIGIGPLDPVDAGPHKRMHLVARQQRAVQNGQRPAPRIARCAREGSQLLQVRHLHADLLAQGPSGCGLQIRVVPWLEDRARQCPQAGCRLLLAPHQQHLQTVVGDAEQRHVSGHEGIELPDHGEDSLPAFG